MTLSFVPGDSLAHRLDPRSKLLVQVAFAAVAYAYTTPRGLALLTLVAVGCLLGAGGGPRDLWSYRVTFPVLLFAPLVAGATLGAPWFRVERAATTGLASYRVLLLLVVAAAYVRSTPVRESRAALQRTIPGRPGVFLGTALVARCFAWNPTLPRLAFRRADAPALTLAAAMFAAAVLRIA
ncbi:cobalt ABC transporter permease [Halorubrum ezzemoulense]|nr:cobalt ABC transporter permease [Halorubrum ezzemoulense]